MRNLKKLGVLLMAVLALGAIATSTASAGTFTASEEGELTGSATTNQVFTAGGEVVCKKAAVSGTITGTEAEEQEAEVNYSECKAYGVATVHVTPAIYLFTGVGTTDEDVHVLNTITLTITKTLFTNHCTITVTPQTVKGGVHYIDNNGHVDVVATVTGITYHSTGSPCPAAGTYTNGTYTGTTTTERAEGGSISYDE